MEQAHDYCGVKMSEVEYRLATTIDAFCEHCFNMSNTKGFYDDEKAVLNILSAMSDTEKRDALIKATKQAFKGMKRDLIHSELGEQTEAARKDLPSDKVPGYSGEEEELADVLVRCGDYAGRNKLRLGAAIVLKMRVNAGRPYMHGKQF